MALAERLDSLLLSIFGWFLVDCQSKKWPAVVVICTFHPRTRHSPSTFRDLQMHLLQDPAPRPLPSSTAAEPCLSRCPMSLTPESDVTCCLGTRALKRSLGDGGLFGLRMLLRRCLLMGEASSAPCSPPARHVHELLLLSSCSEPVNTMCSET